MCQLGWNGSGHVCRAATVGGMVECDSGGWWARFGCLGVAPQTWVDLAVTLISALIAAGIAVVILRSQFKHDRQLATEQLTRADEHAKAAAKLPHIQRLAQALIALGASARTDESRAQIGQLGIDVYAKRQSAVSVEFQEVWRVLQQHLPEAQRFEVQAIWGDVATRWSGCHDAAKAVVATPPPGGFHPELPTPQRMGLSAAGVLAAATGRAERVGLTLLNWDGFSELDLKPALRGWIMDARGRADEIQRSRAIETEFWRLMLAYPPSEDLQWDVREKLEEKVGPADPVWIMGNVFDWP